MFLVRSCLIFMQLWLSYSTELTLDESLLFISTGVSSTAAEGLDIKEAQCNKEQVLKVFYDAQNRPLPPYPVAVVSGVCAEATEAVAAVSKHYCLPVISYSISLEFPNTQELFPHLFSVVPSDYYFAVATVHFINYYKWRRTVVITKDQEHNKRVKEELLTLLKSSNVSVIGDFLLPTLPSRLNDMQFFLPDVRIFILNIDSNEAKVVFCLALRQNIGQYSYVWIIPGWYADRWWEIGGDVILENHRCNSTELAMFIAQQRVIAVSHHPNNLNMTLSEDGVCIQDNITRTLSHDAKQTIIRGLQRTIMEGSGGDLSSCNSGTDSSLCSPETDDCFNRTLASIKSMSFQGGSGIIEFDEVGSRIPSMVNVFQYRTVDRCRVHVAVINVTSNPLSLEFTDGEDTLWLDGVPPDGTPKTEEGFVPLWLTVTANIWSGLVIMASIAFIIFMFIFRKRKLVRLTSPSLNYVIAVGIIMFNIGGMMFIQHRVPFVVLEVFCSIRAWLVSIGISLCFVTINVKMWRIYYIFHYPNPSKRKKVFQDWHLFLVVMLCVVIDVVILTVASSVDSARLKPVETEDVRHGTEVNEDGITLNHTVYLCAARWRLIWLGMLFGFKAIIQMIGLIIALRMRNIKIDVLNDSKEIALSIYCNSAILAIVIIVSVVLEENLTIYGAVYAYGVAISTTAILIIVFFTKVYKLYKDPWGENIFTHDHGTGANALSGAGGSALPTTNVPLGSDDDRTLALEHKLRLVEMELRKYKNCEAVVIDNKTNENGTHSSTRTESEHNLTAETISSDVLDITIKSETSMEHLHP